MHSRVRGGAGTCAPRVRHTAYGGIRVFRTSGAPLAFWADAKKLEPMRDVAEPVLSGNARFEIGRDAIVNLEDLRTVPAHEVMVMMPAGLVLGDFETGTAIAEVDPLHQSELFESRQRAVNRGQIAAFGRERLQEVRGVQGRWRWRRISRISCRERVTRPAPCRTLAFQSWC